ncbi:SDR family NAD(P)-dependent oxidoreductase [Streptomyces sp. OE57]|uniref:SDR family NAD(P)-dependent oxidoreductase n=1 Tax=Streptomyces lacaronensis TaxID=3379885 RepID=UPI0039B72E46
MTQEGGQTKVDTPVRIEEYKGLVGVVTGAGSGIGRAVAQRLLDGGAAVSGWDLTAESLSWLKEHPAGHACTVDVRDQPALSEAARAVHGRWGRVDFLVNSAGLLLQGSLAETAPESARRLFDVNVVGTALVTQALQDSLAQSGGAVVNISSTVALRPSASNALYAASKAAIAQLTRCWALELAPSGVRVNAVAPGPTETNLFAEAGMDRGQAATFLKQRAQQIPLGRTGTPEEIAVWITRLAARDEWMTGQVIGIDGGMSLL